MSSRWPDGWILATLEEANLPISDFTKRVMASWQASTPMLPYTNNPIGMPAVSGRTMELMRTGYAMFATMPLFRAEFAIFVNSDAGHNLHSALALQEKYAPAWRAIHSLGWPASKTESDWPIQLMALMTESTRKRLAASGGETPPTTSGTYGSQTALGDMTGHNARHTAQTAASIQQATRAITLGLRGVR